MASLWVECSTDKMEENKENNYKFKHGKDKLKEQLDILGSSLYIFFLDDLDENFNTTYMSVC